MKGWGAFQRKVGEFYIEAGVHLGAMGTLFEMKAMDVENLMGDGITQDISKEEPLVCLACSSVWIMQTLAHRSAHNQDWMPVLQSINGLLLLASYESLGELRTDGSRVAVEVSTELQIKKILYILIDVYETLRQSDANGYVGSQLGYRYEKDVRAYLLREWSAWLKSLRHSIGVQVMAMAEAHAKYGSKPSQGEMNLLRRLEIEQDTPTAHGSVAHKAACFAKRVAATQVDGAGRRLVSFTEVQAEYIHGKMGGKGGASLRRGGRSASKAWRVVFKLAGGPQGGMLEGSTLEERSAAHPNWSGQCVQFEVTAALPRPLHLEVSVLGDGERLYTGTIELMEFVGYATISLRVDDGAEQVGGSDDGIPSISFYYKLGPWMDGATLYKAPPGSLPHHASSAKLLETLMHV
uniref:Uncharacterized protein n=1 Tax=Haptolina brevifila TaxID=156173 RepID=A0A7S2C0V2_9EUKA|mmetsp:Transcript_19015/g.38752  ORF Transcript_19015/g.38752 Transcript_19015/m.38752 type:complete len:407 (+) Transcript_19015:314-1534(+)